MSHRNKRKLEDFDPNASDPNDSDFDVKASRPSPQRRRPRNRAAGGSGKTPKRQRREYRGSDVDDDDEEIVSDDSFTDRSSSEEIEVNPTTGRSVRRTAQKPVKYEESDADEIEGTPSEDEDESPPPRKRRRQTTPPKTTPPPTKKQSLVIKLKMPKNYNPITGRALRSRAGSKTTTTRGKTPEVPHVGTRRSSRLSHDPEPREPIIALSDSGKHINIVRQGTRSPEPMPTRATRGGKGPRIEAPSTIEEVSQETSAQSAPREADSPGPLDDFLRGVDEDVKISHEAADEHESPIQKPNDAEGEEEMEGVIQESQNDAAADDSDEEPVSRGRALRPRAKSAKRKRGDAESSDFEPAADEEDKEEAEDGETSASETSKPQNRRMQSIESGASGRRSTRLQARTRQTRRSRRGSSSSQESALDAAELAEEAEELATSKRRRLSRRNPDNDLTYDTAPKLRNRATRNTVDYRLIRPEQNTLFDDDENNGPQVERSRTRGGRTGYRSLFSNQGPFGGGLEAGRAGLSAVAGIESDSSDDEIQKVPRIGGATGMTPTGATAPGLAFPQVHNTDAQQNAASGSGPANFGRVKDKKLLADADPLGVDVDIDFSNVGGLDEHINKLKEMVMLPLLYPEVFQQFKITPPRGVLFHGPPGTGKTLLARALASTVSKQGQKVTFYMRKGADALSKWVGEAERQLRLLFEEARKTQPSIIFFDEIDGLAPVRSSKQEQIHASIVATLLALMDGMDGRGQVIVIGATNRPDSVDPALRRPGRFDREFYFPLPDVVGRRSILDIHTKNWEPPLEIAMKDQLAELTKGYGGADLRALCTEAALNAVQGTFPQIYQSERKLVIDPTKIKVQAKDFMVSINKMVPSSQRTVSTTAAPLSKLIEPLLRKPLAEVLKVINELVPRRKKLSALEEAEYDDREDPKGFEREMTIRQFESGRIFRPRLLISGMQGMGQQYLGAALLNKIEGLHVQSFDLPTILEDPGRTPEAAIAQLFTEVRRHKPSVIYIPYVDVWYHTLPAPAIKTFKQLLRTISANEPILLLGLMELADEKEKPDPQMMVDLFSFSQHNRFELGRPDKEGRAEFFNTISHYIRMSPADFPDPDNRKKRVLPVLEYAPVDAPVVDPREIAAKEKQQLKMDRLTLNKLMVAIQPIMDQLKRAHRKFFRPVIDESNFTYLLQEEDPEHFTTDLAPEQQQEQGVYRPWERGKDSKGVDVLVHVETGNRYYNLDLGTIEKRLSNGYYKRPRDFLADIKTLAKDAKTLGDPERTLKANEMAATVEVDLDVVAQNHPALVEECNAVYLREQERARKRDEKLAKKQAENQETTAAAQVAQQTAEASGDAAGPITLGEPIPEQHGVQPNALMRPLTPGKAPNDVVAGQISQNHQNGSSVPSRPGDDAQMTDSSELNTNTQSEFQTPIRPETQTQPFTQPHTQTQKSQYSARTYMAPNSHPGEYHNSASTTTSGQKTSDRSSGARFNTQSTNGVAPAGVPDFADLIPQPGGSQIPDTQEVHYVSSQMSNSQPSQPSQASQPHHNMPAPTAPRNPANIASLLNTEADKPTLILDTNQLQALHDLLVKKSSGCSVEQLEQINAALMDTIWKSKNEYNRNVVIHKVQDAFNACIADIQMMQRILNPSQPEPPSPNFGDTQPNYTQTNYAWSAGQPQGL